MVIQHRKDAHIVNCKCLVKWRRFVDFTYLCTHVIRFHGGSGRYHYLWIEQSINVGLITYLTIHSMHFNGQYSETVYNIGFHVWYLMISFPDLCHLSYFH